MADIKGGQIVYDIIINKVTGEANIKQAERSLTSLGNTAKQTSQSVDSSSKGIKGLLGSLISLINPATLAAAAFASLGLFVKKSVDEYRQAESEQNRLKSILLTATGATLEQVEALNDQADALERVGVVSAGNISVVQSQLATFNLQADTIERLTPAILDYVTAEKGASATADDFKQATNGLAQALNGNFASLTKTGFVLDDATKKLISNGTEAEKAGAIVEVLNSTYKGFNESLTETTDGKIQRLTNQFDNFAENVGRAVVPALEVIGDALIDASGFLSDTGESTEETKQKWEDFGLAIFRVGKLIAGIFQGLVAPVKVFLSFFGTGFVQGVKLANAFSKDLSTIFSNLSTSFVSLGSGLKDIFSGDLEKGLGSLKKAFTGVLTGTGETSKALAEYKSEIVKTAKSTGETLAKDLVSASTNLSQAFDENLAKDAQNLKRIQKVQSDINKQRVKEATDTLTKLTEEEKKAQAKSAENLEKTKEKVLSVTEATKKAYEETISKIKEVNDKFTQGVTDNLKQSTEGLAKIIVDAESKKKELESKINLGGEDATQAREELVKVQAVLDARVGYEQRTADRIKLIRKQLTDAGLDPNALNLEAIQDTASLENAIKEEKINASLNEFQLFEKQQADKLLRLASDYIQESTLLKAKTEQQKSLEFELTNFLTSENIKRTQSVEAFASASILKYGQMASSLRDLISLQSQIGSISGNASETFAVGGMVGAKGGVVGAGEYVIPRGQVANNPDLIKALESNRTGQTNNITINGGSQSDTDLRALTEEMLWKLRRV